MISSFAKIFPVVAALMLSIDLASAATLVKDGAPAATIVIRESALAAEPYKPMRGVGASADAKVKLAAVDLQTYIEKISGEGLLIGHAQPSP